MARQEGLAGERRVASPPGLRAAAFDEEGAEHDQRRQRDQPQAQGVDARVSHVLGPDHQRQDVVTEAGAHRDDEQEQHRAGVHREELVVLVLAHEVVVGPGQLRAHDQRQDAPDHHEGDREHEVHHADLLVVGCRQPFDKPMPLGMSAVVRANNRFSRHQSHSPSPGVYFEPPTPTRRGWRRGKPTPHRQSASRACWHRRRGVAPA